MSFEELGPTFVKLGQLLATRPDLIPEDYVREFAKLHDRVQPLSFEVVEAVLREEFGAKLQTHFRSIDPSPLGSASIAQVHRAVLATGEEVVIKVQRPGIVQTINDDLSVLYVLADLMNRYAPETRHFNPRGIVDEYFRTLELETNFVVEANNIRRFQINFGPDKGPVADKIKIPRVYPALLTERVLVMEALQGSPISNDETLRALGGHGSEILKVGLHAFLKMVFVDGLFHGDLHAGNFLVLADLKTIGLIDFGVVGRINPKTQNAIANILLALSKEDYERMAYEYVDIAPFSDRVNIDLFARELRDLIAPFFGLTLRNVNLGKLLMSTSSIASRHHLQLPSELMLFFKSIVAFEGLGRRIDPDFDFLAASLDFAGELAKHRMDPVRMTAELHQVARESRSLIHALPRQLSFFVRKLNDPNHAIPLDVRGLEDLKKAIEVSFNLVFLGLIMGSLILSASVVTSSAPGAYSIAGIPTLGFVLFLMAGILGVVAFFNYIKKP